MERTIPLTDAGYRLRLSYNQVLRQVMVGELRGERVDGKWKVDADQVEKLARPDSNTPTDPHLA